MLCKPEDKKSSWLTWRIVYVRPLFSGRELCCPSAKPCFFAATALGGG